MDHIICSILSIDHTKKILITLRKWSVNFYVYIFWYSAWNEKYFIKKYLKWSIQLGPSESQLNKQEGKKLVSGSITMFFSTTTTTTTIQIGTSHKKFQAKKSSFKTNKKLSVEVQVQMKSLQRKLLNYIMLSTKSLMR